MNDERNRAQTDEIVLEELPPVQAGDGNLNISDIALAVQVIDYAAAKGALSGWADIITVMSLRNRLYAFWRTARGSGETTADDAADAPTADTPSADKANAAKETTAPVRRRRHKGDGS